MLLYYITDRKGFAGSDSEQRAALLRRIAEAARTGVDYIQLREKDLSSRQLEHLACEALWVVHDNSSTSKLFINSRIDVALACEADGVHLPANELGALEARAIWGKSSNRKPLIGVSVHSPGDLREAHSIGADFAVLAPVFEKVQSDVKGIGLRALREACSMVRASASGQLAVLALGGVNVANARACSKAGADGIAGVRLFQKGNLSETVRRLREL
jgi:thiamine-phosphate pyrophosphorylase